MHSKTIFRSLTPLNWWSRARLKSDNLCTNICNLNLCSLSKSATTFNILLLSSKLKRRKKIIRNEGRKRRTAPHFLMMPHSGICANRLSLNSQRQAHQWLCRFDVWSFVTDLEISILTPSLTWDQHVESRIWELGMTKVQNSFGRLTQSLDHVSRWANEPF